MATQTQVKKFIEMIAPIAVEQCQNRIKKVLPSICIAQACCESAYGTSQKMVNANAVFGIKVGKSKNHFGHYWKEVAYSTKTKECYDGRNYTEITDMFRAYDSIEDAVGDYYDLLTVANRYKGCIGVTDPLKCITEIQKGPYATSPTYIATIMSIVKKYGLTKYDACMTGAIPGMDLFYPKPIQVTTFAATLKSVGVDSSYSYRKKIAIANGITKYIGSQEQNLYLFRLLKDGKLKRI